MNKIINLLLNTVIIHMRLIDKRKQKIKHKIYLIQLFNHNILLINKERKWLDMLRHHLLQI